MTAGSQAEALHTIIAAAPPAVQAAAEAATSIPVVAIDLETDPVAPTPASVGTDSMSNCRHFALKSGKSRNTPVMLRDANSYRSPLHRCWGAGNMEVAVLGNPMVAGRSSVRVIKPFSRKPLVSGS
jgi:hypothetical protein